MNILLVDDEAIFVESVRIGLEGMTYRVDEAYSAEQALEKLSCERNRIDLVVTDYLMPTMNGIDLLKAIRSNYINLSVILMTAYADKNLIMEALNNHCASVIEKPFTLEQLVEEIERVKHYSLQNKKSQELNTHLPRLIHQINNPLSVIKGLAEWILRDQRHHDGLLEDVKIILSAAKQISRINKDIIHAGQMEESKFEPVLLNALLNDCLEMIKGLFVLKTIQVERKIPGQGLWVSGDRYCLGQAFKNIILNAVEAMDNRPEKKLSVTVMPLIDSASVDVTIADTGCGIHAEFLPRIFEPYFTDKPNGNGLGLEICKNIIEKHGGQVCVESQVGIGCTFTVNLPGIEVDRIKESPGTFQAKDNELPGYTDETRRNLRCRGCIVKP